MDILVRLAGVQLGPYSEEQVRDHIADGLLSLTDRAKLAGTEGDDWISLAEILASVAKKNAGLGAQPAPVPEPDEPAEDEAPEAARRAPGTPPGVLHLPARQPAPELDEETGEPTRKTAPIGPKAPRLPSAVGPSSTSIVTSSPLSQTTKKVARAALVKALSSQTSPLPTKAIPARPSAARPPAARPPPAAPPPMPTAPPVAAEPAPHAEAPPMETDEELKVKTVPMRSKPPAPPVPPTLPTTAPLPTRLINKPGSGAFVPPAVPRSKSGRTMAAPPPVPNKPPLILPSAPPAPAPPPDSLAEDLEVPTVKMPTPILAADEFPGAKVPTKPKGKPTDKPADPAAEKPAEKPADQTGPEAKPPKPPRPSRRVLPPLIGAAAVLAAFMAFYVWSPYHAASALKFALDSGDATGLDLAVDFPSVRDSLKAQIKDQVPVDDLTQPANKDYSDAMRAAITTVNHSIDAYVTPEGISALASKSPAAPTGDPTQLISPDEAAKILLAFNTQPVASEGLGSITDFIVDRGPARIHLGFTGLGWKVKRIELRPEVLAAAPAVAMSPVLAPVIATYLARGLAKEHAGDAKGAIADFTQVVSIDPKSAVAFNERATVREATGDSDGAIADFTQALAIDPQLAAAYNGRGNARSAKNDTDGAIADFTQAIQFDPNLATAFDSRGNAKIVKGDADGAIGDFTKAISLDPNLASAFSDRGFARQANGNLDGAVTDYTQALALKPNMARTYYNRALAREAQGNIDAAIVDFDHALAFDPKLADAYFHRANAKSNKEDLDGAIADYNQALTLNPQNAQAFNNRGLAHQAHGDNDAAVADYTAALALDPKIAHSYLNRSVIEAQRNDLDNAIADATQAIYIDPRSALAYSTRGFAKLTKGNLDGAFTDLKVFCDLEPRDHDADHARLYLWLIAKARNSGAEADQDLSSALEASWNSNPEDVNTKTANFLLGRMNEPDYLATAPSPDAKLDQSQHCLVWYFTGMKRALMGDKKGAIDAFHQCVATQQKDFVEYVLAQTELQALEPPVAPAAGPAPAAAPPAAPKTD